MRYPEHLESALPSNERSGPNEDQCEHCCQNYPGTECHEQSKPASLPDFRVASTEHVGREEATSMPHCAEHYRDAKKLMGGNCQIDGQNDAYWCLTERVAKKSSGRQHDQSAVEEQSSTKASANVR